MLKYYRGEIPDQWQVLLLHLNNGFTYTVPWEGEEAGIEAPQEREAHYKKRK